MVFSNAVFLFLFLPMTLAVYYSPLAKSIRAKNLWLLAVSLGFYAWGEPVYIVLMIASIAVNFFLALLAEKCPKSPRGRLIVALSCVYNLGVLFVFKYLSWILRDMLGKTDTPFSHLALPIGISFYTFQSLSYVIDVYRGSEKAQHNILDAGLYIAFFPQLIAGPIVRYGTISRQLLFREHSAKKFAEGVRRFIIGLSKKLLIANTVAPIVFQAFNASREGNCSVLFAWLGVFSFMLQIYFDFSGYSDMAIGLGKMFGFEFLENFNYPYLSQSIGEYWRRWHISLGQWFTDYLFTPVSETLGKKVRKSLKGKIGGKNALKAEYIASIFVVWVATGIWHGANWNFVAWGMMNFVFIVAETLFSKKSKHSAGGAVFRVVRFWFLKMLIDTMFQSASFSSALSYYADMFHLSHNALLDATALYFLGQYKAFLLIGFVFCFPVAEMFFAKLSAKSSRAEKVCTAAKTVLYALLFALCICYAVGGGYNPFIYFNF